MATAKRYLDYRRVLWVGDHKDNLENLIRSAWTILPQSTQRVVPRADGSCVMGASLTDLGADGIQLHCVKYTDRQGVGVIQMIQSASSALGERLPDAQENFLDRDFFLHISGNDVISLNAAKGAAMARTYLWGLFRAARMAPQTCQFDIMQIASPDAALRIAAAGGVQSIQMDLAIEEAAASRLAHMTSAKQSTFDRFHQGMINLVDTIARGSSSAQKLKESNRGSLRVQLSLPDGDLEAAKAAATTIAQEIAEDEDAEDFVLYLRNGEQIKRDAIAVRKLVPLQRSANSFLPTDVGNAMHQYFRELRDSRQLGT